LRESEIQKQVVDYLRVHRHVAWVKVNTTGRFKASGGGRYIIGIPGESDIIGQMKDGRFLAIEIKREGETPSQAQHEFLSLVERNNGVAGWATSVDRVREIIGASINAE